MMGSQTSYFFIFLVLSSVIKVFKKRLSLIYQLFLGLFINRSVKPKKSRSEGLMTWNVTGHVTVVFKENRFRTGFGIKGVRADACANLWERALCLCPALIIQSRGEEYNRHVFVRCSVLPRPSFSQTNLQFILETRQMKTAWKRWIIIGSRAEKLWI